MTVVALLLLTTGFALSSLTQTEGTAAASTIVLVGTGATLMPGAD